MRIALHSSHARIRSFAAGMGALGAALSGCSAQCPMVVQSQISVSVLDRADRPSASAQVTMGGSTCKLDASVPDRPYYQCVSGPGDLVVRATLEGRTASTSIEATYETCAGDVAPPLSLALKP